MLTDLVSLLTFFSFLGFGVMIGWPVSVLRVENTFSEFNDLHIPLDKTQHTFKGLARDTLIQDKGILRVMTINTDSHWCLTDILEER